MFGKLLFTLIRDHNTEIAPEKLIPGLVAGGYSLIIHQKRQNRTALCTISNLPPLILVFPLSSTSFSLMLRPPSY